MRKLAPRFTWLKVSKGRALRLLILPPLLAAAIPLGSASAQENAKWFVLRHDQTGNCWTALLIEVDGDYRHEFAQKAGGPYDTKAEALKREKDLEASGTCNKATQQ